MIKDLTKVQDKVNYLLEKYPVTRDSDKLLWLAYNCEFNGLKQAIGEENYPNLKEWLLQKQTPVFESLSRARRKTQEENKLVQGKRKERLEEAENVKQWSRE